MIKAKYLDSCGEIATVFQAKITPMEDNIRNEQALEKEENKHKVIHRCQMTYHGYQSMSLHQGSKNGMEQPIKVQLGELQDQNPFVE